MSKIVQKVIIPKSLNQEAKDAALEEYRTDEVEELKSYKSYTQVDLDAIDPDSIQLGKKSETGVYFVVADLKDTDEEQVSEQPDLKSKEELDWVLLDDMYTELYAMEGIISGVLRQKNTSVPEKVSMIFSAVDNFKGAAEIILANVKQEDDYKPPERKSNQGKYDDFQKEIAALKSALETSAQKSADKLSKASSEIKVLKEQLEKYEPEFGKFKEKQAALKEKVKAITESLEILKKQPTTQKQSERKEISGTVIRKHGDDFWVNVT